MVVIIKIKAANYAAFLFVNTKLIC